MRRRSICSSLSIGTATVLGAFAILYGTRRQQHPPPTVLEYKKNNEPKILTASYYECPDNDIASVAENFATAPKEHDKWYTSVSQNINETEFLQNFRTMEYDNWGHTYEQVKKEMYSWKSQKYRTLQNGDYIYESACGVGLNLYMTLEIMYNEIGLEDITVFGNEYVPESVNIARTVLHNLPANGKVGKICIADSTQLNDIPSNMFDLVFTGYISPLFNPLQLQGTNTNKNFKQYVTYCQHQTSADTTLSNQAQEHQNNWYAKWVIEMIRIAKPGAPIIIEQVSYPLCDALFDWGGVDRSFWIDAVDKYEGWDIDPESIDFASDTIFRKRYHVFMRKIKRKFE